MGFTTPESLSAILGLKIFCFSAPQRWTQEVGESTLAVLGLVGLES